MKIGIGCDHNGYKLKEQIKSYLTSLGIEYKDFGCHSMEPIDYPDIAFQAAEDIAAGHLERAILVCGTGNGMNISANKIAGVRAALCHDPLSAEKARKSNDAQVLTMGAWIVDWPIAERVLTAWITSEFEGGASLRKVEKVKTRDFKRDQ
ncbi:MAG: ribose 5-phosphate isomerase B [Gorillibacterium sp.]|nr:ribose 5-phosphate isomerase B [Gorillibacterium sp.]